MGKIVPRISINIKQLASVLVVQANSFLIALLSALVSELSWNFVPFLFWLFFL